MPNITPYTQKSATVSDFKAGQTAYTINAKHDYLKKSEQPLNELFNKYIKSDTVTQVGRKYVTLGPCRKFRPTATPKPYMVEQSAYSPEYLLFPTLDEAKEYIRRDVLILRIRNKINNITTNSCKMPTSILEEIEQTLLTYK